MSIHNSMPNSSLRAFRVPTEESTQRDIFSTNKKRQYQSIGSRYRGQMQTTDMSEELSECEQKRKSTASTMVNNSTNLQRTHNQLGKLTHISNMLLDDAMQQDKKISTHSFSATPGASRRYLGSASYRENWDFGGHGKSNGRPSVPNALDATVKPVIQAEEKGILTERGSQPKKNDSNRATKWHEENPKHIQKLNKKPLNISISKTI